MSKDKARLIERGFPLKQASLDFERQKNLRHEHYLNAPYPAGVTTIRRLRRTTKGSLTIGDLDVINATEA